MVNPEYVATLDKIKKTDVKINDAIDKFSPDTILTSNDLTDYHDSLKVGAILFKKFKDLVNDVIIKPPEGVDEEEVARLTSIQDSLKKAVINHKTSIKMRVTDLC